MLNSQQKYCFGDMYFVSLRNRTNKKPKAMRLVFLHTRAILTQTNKYQAIKFYS